MKIFIVASILLCMLACSAYDESLSDLIMSDCPQEEQLVPVSTYNFDGDHQQGFTRVYYDSNYVYVVHSSTSANKTRLVMLDSDLKFIAEREEAFFTIDAVSEGLVVGREDYDNLSDTIIYKSIDIVSGDTEFFHEVALPKYYRSVFQSSQGKHYYLQSTRASKEVVLLEFDASNDFIAEPIYTLDTLPISSIYSYTVYHDSFGDLILLAAFSSNLVKVNTRTGDVRYLIAPSFSEEKGGNISRLVLYNGFRKMQTPTSISNDLIVDISTFDRYMSGFKITLNDTLILQGAKIYDTKNEESVFFNSELWLKDNPFSENWMAFYVEPWAYLLLDNTIYVHDQDVTRNKLMKYNFISNCTEALHHLDSELIKLDKKRAIAYVRDDEGLKKFILQ